jgi:uncharacterized protein (DUF1810 family)
VAHHLDRFVAAQDSVYEGVIGELRRGRKTGHWMWFIFPQLSGLGRSEMSRYYAIASLHEGRAYLEHPVLGARLRECANAVLALPAGRSAEDIFGSVDAVKLRSSMTLFQRAAPDDPLFRQVLERFFHSVPDEATDALLSSSADQPGRGSKAAG